jgi:hypothetical protein
VARPDSLTSVMRMWLAGKINVMPPDGVAWCMNCSMNNGITVVLGPSPDPLLSAQYHAKTHSGSNHRMSMRIGVEKYDDR